MKPISIVIDLLSLSGVGLIVAGVALIHGPSALIVAGLFCLILGVIGAYRS